MNRQFSHAIFIEIDFQKKNARLIESKEMGSKKIKYFVTGK